MMKFNIETYDYPDKPQAEIGKFFKSGDGKYFYQRKDSVLFINPDTVIASHCVGFLENNNNIECSKEEFITVLNTTVHNLNILNDEFKLN